VRIAVIHSFYSSDQPSGENIAVEAQVDALRAAGHDVVLIAQHTDARRQSPTYSIQAAWTTISGRGSNPLGELHAHRPDVVHVHNLFPNWGTQWLGQWSGRVVATLHNYRSLCAAATLFRDGNTCTLCPDGSAMASLVHACYKSSRVATAPLTVGTARRASQPLLNRPDALIALSQRAHSIFRKYGVSAEKLVLLPNFVVPTRPTTVRNDRSERWVFVGRLSPEKGVLEMLASWPQSEPLDIIGDGPLASEVAARMPPSARLISDAKHREITGDLGNYLGLVFPGRCQESAVPLVVLEAMAAGLPIIALGGSAASDLVDEADLGAVTTDDSWALHLNAVKGAREYFSHRSIAMFEERFTRQRWVNAITALYESVVGQTS
jgi:glycosyltransferase involved in cell wall biosynthesis